MKRTYFGTDGVRGPYGGPVINERFAAQLGRAAGQWCGGRGLALIGRDPRSSGASLTAAVAAGLQAAGLTVADLGMVPTPAVAQAAKAQGALGVVITASHNPATDNGIKFFTAEGVKLSDEDEAAIEALLDLDAATIPPIAVAAAAENVVADYIEAAVKLLPVGALDGWKLALDTANGATCFTSAGVLSALGATVLPLGDKPQGSNINASVGSEHPEQLAASVKAAGARMGIAHDGDGDRCILCDENGDVLDGDEVLGVLGLHAMRQKRLAANTLVVTVQSNLGVDAAIEGAGGFVVRTPVGDRHVAARMRELGAELGGESSGHIICSDVATTGDGLIAALRVIEVMLETGEPLSLLRRQVKLFPQRSVNLRVGVRIPLESCVALQAAIAVVEGDFGREGRVLIRYSGTEAKLRLLVEGPDDARVAQAMDQLERAARLDLEVV